MIFRFGFFVDHVYDGDTLMGVADLGLAVYLGREDTGEFWSVRFYGINAPEVKGATRDAGIAARDFLRSIVARGDVLEVESHGWDKYQRRIDGIPYKNGVDLCSAMVAAGHARRD